MPPKGGADYRERYIPPEERLKKELEARLVLWISMIDLANLEEPVRERFKKAVMEPGFDKYAGAFDNYIYGKINTLLNVKGEVIAGGANEAEVNALVSNLKSDMWAFYSEQIKY